MLIKIPPQFKGVLWLVLVLTLKESGSIIQFLVGIRCRERNEMDTDKIKKLIKLANNNPNDNEANLAARKVCSMLKDHTFGTAPQTTRIPNRSPYDTGVNWSHVDPFAEWFRSGPYREASKSEYAQYRSKTQEPKQPKYEAPPRGRCASCQRTYPHFKDGAICNACRISTKEREKKEYKPPKEPHLIVCTQCRTEYIYSGQDMSLKFVCGSCQLKNMKAGLNPDGSQKYQSPFMGDF